MDELTQIVEQIRQRYGRGLTVEAPSVKAVDENTEENQNWFVAKTEIDELPRDPANALQIFIDTYLSHQKIVTTRGSTRILRTMEDLKHYAYYKELDRDGTRRVSLQLPRLYRGYPAELVIYRGTLQAAWYALFDPNNSRMYRRKLI